MEDRASGRKWPYIVVAAVGMVVIVAGNVLTAAGSSFELQNWGRAIRQLGLTVCVFTGLVFLIARNAERWRRIMTPKWPQVHLSAQESNFATNTTGPSPMLIALIRIYCALLILTGLYAIGALVWQMILNRGMSYWFWWSLLYTVVSTLLTLAPGFLIWGLINAIVRMSQELDSLSRRTAQLEFRLHQDSADRRDSPKLG